VFKATLVFNTRFWGDRLPTMGFVHVPEARIPTWWSAWREPAPVLVAWAGGGAADRLRGLSPVDVAVAELAPVLGTSEAAVRRELVAVHHHDWSADPWAGGAYAYVAVGGVEAQYQAHRPLEGTLFFACQAGATGSEGSP